MKANRPIIMAAMSVLCCWCPPASAISLAMGCEVVLVFYSNSLVIDNKILNEKDFGYSRYFAFAAAKLRNFRGRSHDSGTYYVTGDALAEENDTLSHSLAKNRANVARDWLILLGVSPTRIMTSYFPPGGSPIGEIDFCSDACLCILSQDRHSYVLGPQMGEGVSQ